MINMSTDDYKFLLKEVYSKHVHWWFLQQTYVGVHSAPWQCLEILKTNHSVLWLYLGILKTNHSVLWLYLVSCIDIKRLRYSRASLVRTSKKHNHNTMYKKRLKITLKVLNDVKQEYPGTKKYIRRPSGRVFQRKHISRRGNFSFTYREAKS